MKFTKQDWINKGINFLFTEGSHAIMIDYMCDRLRITKGSFYHYFEGIDEYVLLVVKQWEKNTTEELEKISASETTAEKQLDLLREFTFRYSGRIELGLRGWSLYNKKIKTIIDRVEDMRIELLSRVFISLGASKNRARELAEALHAGWIGILVCELNTNLNREKALEELRDIAMSNI